MSFGSQCVTIKGGDRTEWKAFIAPDWFLKISLSISCDRPHGFSGIIPDWAISHHKHSPSDRLVPQSHTIPSLRLRNEGQLTHFPCSPALSTSCLFIKLHVSMLPQRLPPTPYINSYLWLHCFSRDLERNAKDALNCWAMKCKHSAGRCCLLFSFSKRLSLRVHCVSISEPGSDSVDIQSLRKQRGYIPLSVLNSGLIRRPVGNSPRVIQLCDSQTAQHVELLHHWSLCFTLYVQNWHRE